MMPIAKRFKINNGCVAETGTRPAKAEFSAPGIAFCYALDAVAAESFRYIEYAFIWSCGPNGKASTNTSIRVACRVQCTRTYAFNFR